MGSRTTRSPGPNVLLDCPACHVPGLTASAYEEHQTLTFAFVLPLWTDVQTFVVCPACNATLKSPVPMGQLPATSPAELKRILRPHASPIRRSLAAIAWVTSIIPFLGVVVSLIAVGANWRSPGWAKPAAIYSLLPSALFCFWQTPMERLFYMIAN